MCKTDPNVHARFVARWERADAMFGGATALAFAVSLEAVELLLARGATADARYVFKKKEDFSIFWTRYRPCVHQNAATFCSFLYILRSILDSI